MENKVISIDELKKMKNGELVQIPSWYGNDYINVRLKRVNSLNMLAHKKIPNELLGAAATLFNDDKKLQKKKNFEEEIQENIDLIELFKIFAKESLVEPTFEDIEAEMPLTVSQLSAIYNFCNTGINELKPSFEE